MAVRLLLCWRSASSSMAFSLAATRSMSEVPILLSSLGAVSAAWCATSRRRMAAERCGARSFGVNSPVRQKSTARRT